MQATASGLPGDTLILDGEVVEIERTVVRVDLDSMQEAAWEDVREPAREHRTTVAFLGGACVNRTSFTTLNDSLTSLDEFMGSSRRFLVGYGIQADAAWYLSDHVAFTGGIGLSRVRYAWTAMDDAQLAPADMRFRFEEKDGELLQYFTYEVGPGFETDTTAVPTFRVNGHLDILELPFGMRFRITSPRSKRTWNWYADLSANYRLVLNNAHTADDAFGLSMVNEGGAYQRVGTGPLAARHSFDARLAVFTRYEWKDGWYLRLQWNLNFPPRIFTEEYPVRLQFSNYHFLVGISRDL